MSCIACGFLWLDGPKESENGPLELFSRLAVPVGAGSADALDAESSETIKQ